MMPMLFWRSLAIACFAGALLNVSLVALFWAGNSLDALCLCSAAMALASGFSLWREPQAPS